MECKYCGKELPENAKTCPKCYAEVDEKGEEKKGDK